MREENLKDNDGRDVREENLKDNDGRVTCERNRESLNLSMKRNEESQTFEKCETEKSTITDQNNFFSIGDFCYDKKPVSQLLC